MVVAYRRIAVALGCFCLVLVGCLHPLETQCGQPLDGGGMEKMLSPEAVRKKASADLYATPWLTDGDRLGMKGSLVADHPLLVQRIDRQNDFYYLVPFNIEALTVVVVIVDAKTGRFKESARMRPPDLYLKVNAAQAETILATYLSVRGMDDALPSEPPRLVWKPCQQTLSPYEPLWVIKRGATQWFVDQLGRVYAEITERLLKGGGMNLD